MSKPVRVSREAREELLEAAPLRRVPRGIARRLPCRRVVRYAQHLGSPPGIDPSLGVKRVFMKRFPYSVYFVELPTRFRVLAVAHGRRKPFYWRGRL